VKQLLLVSALASLVATAASATTFVRVSDAALADQARLAVVGVVETRHAAPGRLATDYRVRVEQTLAGDAREEIVVRVPGGGEGPRRLKIWGAPTFHPGERVLLFLAPAETGTWRVLHLFLGAVHTVTAGDRALAVQAFSDASEVTLSADGLLRPAEKRSEPIRDLDAFAAWVKARRHGESAPDYHVAEGAAGDLGSVVAAATYFQDRDDLRRMRWFEFDTGGHIGFRAYNVGETGLSGGGYSEFQTALAAWNAETQTPIDYRYDGKTSNSEGPVDSPTDSLNTIVFNDPHHLLDPFDCLEGGVLALGGPVYFTATQPFRGEQFHAIESADIVVAAGLTCFFNHSINASKAAQELFAHELGHTLGLAHSCGDSVSPGCGNAAFDDALMRAYVHDDARGARLGSDDIAGIRSLYQPSGAPTAPGAPTSLAATATSTTQVHLTWQDNATDETGYVVEFAPLGATTYQQAGATLPANSTSGDVGNLAEATGYQFRVRARNAAGDSPNSNVVTAATKATIAPCVVTPANGCLHGGRFAVRVDWATGGGDSGAGTVIPYTDDSALAWFFGASNIEMLVKVLDACVTETPRFWVFFAGTTDVEFRLTVIDTATGTVRVYLNPLGHNADAVSDVSAFATCP
jgi:hypothetical protein